MFHTVEVIQQVNRDDIRCVLQCLPVKSLEHSYAYITKRLKKSEELLDGDYERDEGFQFLSDVDTVTKILYIDASDAAEGTNPRPNGINGFKLMRICSKDHKSKDQSFAYVSCTFYLTIEINLYTLLTSQAYTIQLYKATPENNEQLAGRFEAVMRSIFCREDERLAYLCGFREWDDHRIDCSCNMYFASDDEFKLFLALTHKTSSLSRTKKLTVPGVRQMEQSAAEGNKSYKSLFYDKQDDIRKKYKKDTNPRMSSLLAEAHNVIRMEQQVKKGAVRRIQEKYGFPDRKLYRFLREDIAYDELDQRYKKMIGDGDFMHREEAKRIIRASEEKPAMQEKLIQFLQLMAQKRHLDVAKKAFVEGTAVESFPLAHGTVKTFNDRINKLRSLGINPMLIPDACPVRRLKNPKYMLQETPE